MSAVAAARKRRAGPLPNDPSKNVPVPVQNTPSPPSGLTLPQVIALVDKRLVILEKFMNERSASSMVSPIDQIDMNVSSGVSDETVQEINDVLDDYNARFVLLTEEISNIKDVVLKLQSFTMEVNKMLVEERLGNVEFVLETPLTNLASSVADGSNVVSEYNTLPDVNESVDFLNNEEDA